MEALSCDDVRALLSAWIDDELPPTVSVAVARHLEACPACARDLDELRRTGDLVREVAAAPTVPEAFRARVRAAVRAADRSASGGAGEAFAGRRRGRWPGLAAAGLVIAFASSAITYVVVQPPRPPAAAALAADAVERHVQALMSHDVVDVSSDDRHTVKPWFDGRVDFSPTVPRLDSLGFPLLGGRVDQVGGRTVAALVYGRRLHVIDVFTWPSARGSASSETTVRGERGYHVLHWSRDGMEFLAVSDVAISDLRGFAASFARAAGPDDGEGSF